MISNSTFSIEETDQLRALSNLLCKDEESAAALLVVRNVVSLKNNRLENAFIFIIQELDNSSFVYSPTLVLKIINKIQDPEIKTFMQTTWDNYHGANKIS